MSNTAVTANNITAGQGNEILTYTGSGNTTLFMYGGTGLDTMTQSGTGVASETISDGSFGGRIIGGIVTGTENLSGRGGSDYIVAGAVGSAGSATGSALKEIISGGATGNDTIYAYNANSTITGGAGRDSIYVVDNTGLAHNHLVNGGSGASRIDMTGVSDSYTSAASTVTYGADTIIANSGNDTLIGSNTVGVTDWFGKATGAVFINENTAGGAAIGGIGNAVNETLGFGWFANSYEQSLGSAAVGVTVNLATGVATGTLYSASGVVQNTINEHFTNIGNVLGTNYNDVITTAATAGHIYTGAGNDTINVGTSGTLNTGNETITGGTGNKLYNMVGGTEGTGLGANVTGDVINGGSGNDTLSFANDTITTGSVAVATLGLTSTSGTYTNAAVTGVYVNLSYQDNLTTQSASPTFGVNFAGTAGEGTIAGITTVIGQTNANNYMVGASGVTLQGGGQNDTLLGGQSGLTHDVLVGNSTLLGGGTGTIYDGTSSFMANWMEIGNDAVVNGNAAANLTLTGAGTVALGTQTVSATTFTSGNPMDNIYGFNEVYADKLYVKLSSLGDVSGFATGATTVTGSTATTAQVTASGWSGSATTTYTHDNGVFTEVYAGALNAAGTHNLVSATLDNAGIIVGALTTTTNTGSGVTGSQTSTTAYTAAAATTHGEFLFDTVTGNLYWDSNNLTVGSNALSTTTITQTTATAATTTTTMTAGVAEVAHIDLGSAIATGGSPLSTLTSGDFVLSA